MFNHTYLFIFNDTWLFPFPFLLDFALPCSILSLNICITLLSFLNTSTVLGFLYVKTMTKSFYSQFWKSLNLTMIVFYDNLCFHVRGLLSFQHFSLTPKYEQFHISALAENESLYQKYILMEKKEHVSLKSPDLTP